MLICILDLDPVEKSYWIEYRLYATHTYYLCCEAKDSDFKSVLPIADACQIDPSSNLIYIYINYNQMMSRQRKKERKKLLFDPPPTLISFTLLV